jgi:hypothetical protein
LITFAFEEKADSMGVGVTIQSVAPPCLCNPSAVVRPIQIVPDQLNALFQVTIPRAVNAVRG